MIGYFLLFLSIDFLFSLSGIQFPPILLSCIMCSSHSREPRAFKGSGYITDIVREGTVFQTAVPLCVIVPRLRPGLLSLRSVLPSRQSLLSCLFGKVLFVFDITWGDKASMDKNMGKIDNDIFVCFYPLMFFY